MSAALGVIPARLGSERLPRKPLHPIAGRPLIQWVWERVRTFPALDTVVVATDSPEVVDACQGFGAEAVMTAASHGSGTERVAEVAGRAEYAGYDVVVNIQGDEPFITQDQVEGAAARVEAGWDVGTVAAPVRTLEAWRDPSVVKVVRNGSGGALYFSRAPIPHSRGREPTADDLASSIYLRHIGVYAYTVDALGRWVEAPPSELEALERLEQLRALEAGLRIGVAVVDRVEGGVDTPADVRRAEERLRREGETH
ncbi:MAG: 3-deoxy-manno-octulosonate cytidylyltransferase [Longimicrobiales bacterium]|nr:3-deoxy-manno-octulosonate cytidylyltransferase [Longimicrobiales bacterium]